MSAPSWVPTGARVHLDFSSGRYWDGAANAGAGAEVALSTLLTFVEAPTIDATGLTFSSTNAATPVGTTLAALTAASAAFAIDYTPTSAARSIFEVWNSADSANHRVGAYGYLGNYTHEYTGSSDLNTAKPADDTVARRVGWTWNTGGKKGCLNGGAVSTNAAAASPTGLNAARLGRNNAGSFPNTGAWRSITVYDAYLSDAQLQAATSAPTASPAARKIVSVGDSLTLGTYLGGSAGNSYPGQLATRTGIAVVNQGVNSRTIDTMRANYVTEVRPELTATLNQVIILGGINDILINSTSAVDIDADLRAFCATARADGAKVYVGTLTPVSTSYPDWTSAKETIRQAVNTDRRANWQQYADGLKDFGGDSRLSDPNNATYYGDGLHMTTAGYGVMAEVAATYVVSVESGSGVVTSQAVSLSVSRRIAVEPSVAQISGGVVDPTYGASGSYAVAISVGSIPVSGAEIALERTTHRVVEVSASQIPIAGATLDVAYSSPSDVAITISPAQLRIAGLNVVFRGQGTTWARREAPSTIWRRLQ